MKRTLPALVLLICLIAGLGPVRAAEPEIRLVLDGVLLEPDAAPRIVNDRVLVPVRVIGEALGAPVSWDGATRTVTVAAPRPVVLTVGSAAATVGGERVTLDAPAQVFADRTFVPLRFIAQALGFKVGWEPDTRTVRLNAPAQPDVDVLYIERTPRISFDPLDTSYSTGLPNAGQAMIYYAHVKNWGIEPVDVLYEWRFDGQVAAIGSTTVGPDQVVQVPFPWNWEAADHDLEFVADPNGTLREVSTLNNSVSIRTNALLLGLWVEQSLYEYFHAYQHRLHDGANSFEDWAQRHVRRMNELMAKAVSPVAPQGVLDRIALDKVIVVPDGTLGFSQNLGYGQPRERDRTVDLTQAFAWVPGETRPGGHWEVLPGGPFMLNDQLLHFLTHARYHPDTYSLQLSKERRNVAIEVRVPAPDGAPLAGSPYLPEIRPGMVYFVKGQDIMTHQGHQIYDQFSAGLWNRKHHRRGRDTVQNGLDHGLYYGDLPERNRLYLHDQRGLPLAGARVQLYQAQGDGTGKWIDGVPDLSFTAGDDGQVDLPQNPFGDQDLARAGTALLRIDYDGQRFYTAVDVTAFNLEYWRGNAEIGQYRIGVDLPGTAYQVPAEAWLGSYYTGEFNEWITSRRDASLDFTWSGAPVSGVDASDYSAYWVGDFTTTEGWKRFSITAVGGVQLYLDGQLLFDQWENTELKSWTQDIYTLEGAWFTPPGRGAANPRRRLEVRYRPVPGQVGRIALSWKDQEPPEEVPAGAWRADYYHSPDLTGYITSRTITAIDLATGKLGLIAEQRNPNVGGSIRWTGDWAFAGGSYAFTGEVRGALRVQIDGQTVLDESSPTETKRITFTKALSAGKHRIEVDYARRPGEQESIVRFGWQQSLR